MSTHMRPQIKNLTPAFRKAEKHTYTSIPLGDLVRVGNVDGGQSYKLEGGPVYAWRDRAVIHEVVEQVMDKLDEYAAAQEAVNPGA